VPLGREGREREGVKRRDGRRRERGKGRRGGGGKGREWRRKDGLERKKDLVLYVSLFPAEEQRPGLGSNQFLSSNHMDISQLRGLASVGPARADLVEGQVPGQGTIERGGH
jgi:hypothetical protein